MYMGSGMYSTTTTREGSGGMVEALQCIVFIAPLASCVPQGQVHTASHLLFQGNVSLAALNFSDGQGWLARYPATYLQSQLQ